MASDLIPMSITLTETADYKVNTMVEYEGEHYIIRSIVRIWYNPIKKKHFMICKGRKFTGDFIDMPF